MQTTPQTERTKEVAYAYPHSPNAINAGMAETGCYVVYLTSGEIGPIPRKYFRTRDEAFAYADSLPEQYNKWSMKR